MFRGNKSINDMASDGDLAGIQEKVRRGKDLNKKDEKGRTAVELACENGHLDVVVFLEKNGAMPSTWSMLSIVDIAAKGDLVGVEYKIMHKANLNQVV